jgi:hypothetical protein
MPQANPTASARLLKRRREMPNPLRPKLGRRPQGPPERPRRRPSPDQYAAHYGYPEQDDYYAAVDAEPRVGLVPMRVQRFLYAMAIAIAVSVYTNPAMWAHLDRIGHPYAGAIKVGLIGIIDLTLLALTNWLLNGRTRIHRLYCTGAALLLTVAMLFHAGLVSSLEEAHGEGSGDIAEIRDGLAAIGKAQAEGASGALGQQAIEANGRGQRRLAEKLQRQAVAAAATNASAEEKFIAAVTEKKAKLRGESAGVDWYARNMMYWALMALAFTLGAGAVLLSEDRSGAGVPDFIQRMGWHVPGFLVSPQQYAPPPYWAPQQQYWPAQPPPQRSWPPVTRPDYWPQPPLQPWSGQQPNGGGQPARRYEPHPSHAPNGSNGSGAGGKV